MSSITELDLKILRELRKDATQSASDIANKLDKDQQQVKTRINDLESNGAIRAYRVNIDPAKIGYGVQSYHFVGAADNYDETLEMGLSTFNQWNGVQLIKIVLGQYDLILRKISEDGQTYNNFAKNLIDRPDHPSFAKRQSYRIDERFRWNGTNIPKGNRIPPERHELDPIDQDILRELQKDAKLRNRPEDLAAAVDEDPGEVMKAVNNLEERNVIIGYTIDIGVNELGWHRSFLGLAAIQGGFDSAVEGLMDLDPLHVPYITTGSGYNWSDVAVELVVRSVDHLDDLTDDIRVECDAKETRTFLSTKPLQNDIIIDI